MYKTGAHAETNNGSGQNSTNTSFKLVGGNKSYRGVKTPLLNHHRREETIRDKSQMSIGSQGTMIINSNDINVDNKALQSLENQHAREERLKVTHKSSHLNLLKTVIPQQVNLEKVREFHQPQNNQVRSFEGTIKELANTYGIGKLHKNDREESSEYNREDNLLTGKPKTQLQARNEREGEVDYSESRLNQKMIMSPPLVMFAGQSAIRLDPLLTRKSSSKSGSRDILT